MALTNVLLLSQIAGYLVGLILSFCVVVPMSMHQHQFNGHCLLFSHGLWNETDGQLQIYRLSVLMYKGLDSSFLSAFLEAVGCMVLCALGVSAAIVVTLGFMSWCQVIVQRFTSCEVAAGLAIDKKDKISTKSFYIEIGTAQFGAWAAFATFVGLAVFSTLKVVRYHQLENIQVSMYRERQRLVNDSGSPAPLPGRSTPPLEA